MQIKNKAKSKVWSKTSQILHVISLDLRIIFAHNNQFCHKPHLPEDFRISYDEKNIFSGQQKTTTQGAHFLDPCLLQPSCHSLISTDSIFRVTVTHWKEYYSLQRKCFPTCVSKYVLTSPAVTWLNVLTETTIYEQLRWMYIDLYKGITNLWMISD